MRLMATKLLFSFLLIAAGAAAQWQTAPVQVPTTASLRGLSPVDAKVVWASGTNGTVLRTIDGGETWEVRRVAGAEKLDFRGIRAFDANTAVAMSSGKAEEGLARIYRTSDGGLHWSLVLEEKTPGVFFDAIAFWDREHGIVVSDPVNGRFVLFVTADGGKTWKRIAPEKIPPALPNEGAFAASNSCLAVQGERNVWFGTGGAGVARVFRSSDGGHSWTATKTPMHPPNASSGVFSIAFRDGRNGVAVGGDYAHADSSAMPNVLFTSDGGKTWRAVETTSPAGVYLSSVTYVPEVRGAESASGERILAAGSAGIFLKEAGKGWVRENDGDFNVIAFVSAGNAWAVGPKGKVVGLKKEEKHLTQSSRRTQRTRRKLGEI